MPYTVTYNGNGSDGGSVPVDPQSPYNAGVKVTVLAAGSLSKTGAVFAYWNTNANGSGTTYGWPTATTFNMPAANVVLYAQWFVTTGLTAGGPDPAHLQPGLTNYYEFYYDSSLAASGLEPGRTNTVLQNVDIDYGLMQGWFPGVTAAGPSPIPVYVTSLTGGANNTGTIRLKPNTNDPNELRALLVAEVTESFMNGQNKGWGFLPGVNNEESCGEALSIFLTSQFQISIGASIFAQGAANNWLNTSLPSSNPSSTRFTSDANCTQVTDWGSRADYVNSLLPCFGNGPGTGCSLLFIYYLFHQLGFTINEIIAAAPGYTNGVLNALAPLRGVYQNLTQDSSDPFPYFSQLLASAYPPDQVSSIPGPNDEDPWPIAIFQYSGVKDDFGKDEVNDLIAKSNGVYTNGFSLQLDGFNQKVLGNTTPATPTIAFGGVTAQPSSPAVTYQFNNPKIPQRVLFNYDIHFTPPLGTFPTTGETPARGQASIVVLQKSFPAQTEFFFLAGADPYFLNVQPNANVQPNPQNPPAPNAPWLSQDVRVFTVTPGLVPTGQDPVPAPTYVAPPSYPVPAGAPSFTEPASTTYGNYDIQGAYTYITNLIGWLNGAYGDPSKADPFDVNNSILPGQQTAYTGDSSVTPGTKSGGITYNNYNFAIARVRLQGSAGQSGAAQGVKVFFRLWQTQTADTDWNPGYTYLSDDPTGLNPQYPVAPPDNHTIPFFASGNYPVTNDAPNNQNITINQGDTQWAYFGCFLNLYDSTFSVNNESVQQQFAQGTHHCLVAEIAFKDAPIQNTGGNVETTSNSDQLAQRNLQVSTSANPGNLATHRIPQTFDIRRTAPEPQALLQLPDELMIQWGNTPPGCLAGIYWPAANASDILTIASRIYGSQVLSAADPHTIQCKTVDGVTYVPIPQGTGDSLAGLFTIDVPSTVVKGQEFNIVIHRIGTRRVNLIPTPPPPPQTQIVVAPTKTDAKLTAKTPTADSTNAVTQRTTTERYVVGSFQVKIPVQTKSEMLPAEETTLAILKARLAVMAPTNRWLPVLERYIGLISARVDGLGGHAKLIPSSFLGYNPSPAPHGGDGGGDGRHPHEHLEERTGKIGGLIFDHSGDFEGFILNTEDGEHKYYSRERDIRTLAERVWSERLRITVFWDHESPCRPRHIIIREPPAPFKF